MSEIAIFIPAAGASNRMEGKDKLLEPIYGEPILRRIAARACATGANVFVTVPDMAHPRVAALKGLSLTTIPVADAKDGMAASFRAVIAELAKNTHAMLVVLPDMPDISGSDMALFLNAFSMVPDQPILRAASASGQAGHPVLLPDWCFEELAQISGDKGARDVLVKHAARVALLPLQDDRARCDLDTPKDWTAWRKKNPDA